MKTDTKINFKFQTISIDLVNLISVNRHCTDRKPYYIKAAVNYNFQDYIFHKIEFLVNVSWLQ